MHERVSPLPLQCKLPDETLAYGVTASPIVRLLLTKAAFSTRIRARFLLALDYDLGNVKAQLSLSFQT
jgi:hypothetical protein